MSDAVASRLVTIIGILAMMAALGVVCAFLITDRTATIRRAEAETRQIASLSATLVDQLVNDVDSLATGFRTAAQLADIPFADFVERSTPWLNQSTSAKPIIGGFLVLDDRGYAIASSTESIIGKLLSFRAYFNVHLGRRGAEKFVSEPILSRSGSGARLFLISWPVHDKAGKLVGVLAFTFATDALEALLRQVDEVPGDTVSVVIGSGAILSSLGTAGGVQALELNHREPLLTGSAELAMSGSIARSRIETGSLWDTPGEWLLASAPLDSFPGAIVTSRDNDIVLAPWWTRVMFGVVLLMFIGTLKAGVVILLHDLIRYRAREFKRAAKAAATDPLTGLANRRAFDDRAEVEWSRARREDAPLALLVFDLDKFKAVNDRYGHAAGDRVLQAVSKRISELVRREDVLARTGGEEFALLLPKMREEAVMGFANRLVKAIEALDIRFDGKRIAVTISAGVCVPNVSQMPVSQAIRFADAALYEAKRQGRNQAVFSKEGRAALEPAQVAAE